MKFLKMVSILTLLIFASTTLSANSSSTTGNKVTSTPTPKPKTMLNKPAVASPTPDSRKQEQPKSKYDSQQFNLDVENLPPFYYGNDIFESFLHWKGLVPYKSEFETTVDYNNKVQSILSPLTDQTYAFLLESFFIQNIMQTIKNCPLVYIVIMILIKK
jgi:hypothetical protein